MIFFPCDLFSEKNNMINCAYPSYGPNVSHNKQIISLEPSIVSVVE